MGQFPHKDFVPPRHAFVHQQHTIPNVRQELARGHEVGSQGQAKPIGLPGDHKTIGRQECFGISELFGHWQDLYALPSVGRPRHSASPISAYRYSIGENVGSPFAKRFWPAGEFS
ncbi:hypothetical protein GCM10027400_20630 [Pseudoxanthomonas daejeonensis]